MRHLYHVAVAPGVDYECVGPEDVEFEEGEMVVIRCERYQDIATVTARRGEAPEDQKELDRRHARRARGRQIQGPRMPKAIRRASTRDLEQAAENDERVQEMLRTATERSTSFGLDMKLINGHLSFDRRLVVLQFTADGRVDFRELLRDLSRRLRTRVELRQVGVRDEAAIQGGIGSCGRPFCCATFLRRFQSINVKMAKRQGLSLNPVNISGACGRLKCCLQYDVHLYRNGRIADEAEDGADREERREGRPRSRESRGGDRESGRDQSRRTRDPAEEEPASPRSDEATEGNAADGQDSASPRGDGAERSRSRSGRRRGGRRRRPRPTDGESSSSSSSDTRDSS